MSMRMIGRSTRRRNGERGAELIEFALVFPLLMLVVLGCADFAFVFQRNEVITNAAREGARVAILPGYLPVDVQTRVNEFLTAGGLPTGPATTTVTPTTIPVAGLPAGWPATTVNVTFLHNYMFIGAVGSWFGGAFSNVTLTGQSTMRNELLP